MQSYFIAQKSDFLFNIWPVESCINKLWLLVFEVGLKELFSSYDLFLIEAQGLGCI